MALDRSIYLIGYRGTGKSTVARCLADRFGCEPVDSDELAERRGYRTIAEIFAEEGEQAFRQLEQQVVGELAAGPARVVALGGGAVLREANREAIAQGHIVWLTATPETLAERLKRDELAGARRPSLTSDGLLQEIAKVLADRTPLYKACATLVVDTEHRTPQQVADEVYAKVAGK